MVRNINGRRQERGRCNQRWIQWLPLKKLVVVTAQGGKDTWASYKQLLPKVAGVKIGDVMEISRDRDGAVLFSPRVLELPLKSSLAHLFREICLVILVNYPELIVKWEEEQELEVHHSLEDKNHIFTIDGDITARVWHSWASSLQEVQWKAGETPMEDGVAQILEVPNKSVWVVPHTWLQRIMPIWAGARRWKLSRKQVKTLIRRRREGELVKGLKMTEKQWELCNSGIASALKKVAWKTLHKMEGVSAYKTQNLVKLKQGKLRLWMGKERGYRCGRRECQLVGRTKEGRDHLIWSCPDAHAIWTPLRMFLGGDSVGVNHATATQDRHLSAIFSLGLQELLQWLTQWGTERNFEPWEELRLVGNQVWGLMCATAVTAIWRWNVDRKHSDESRPRRIEEAVEGVQGLIRAALTRFRLGLYPVNSRSKPKILVAEFLEQRWREGRIWINTNTDREVMRVGFFDGGSRGNPGPGGSGSVIVETNRDGTDARVVWAAATAVGHKQTTNNVAEFIGLHRLLARAVEMGWERMQIVGDSAMILRMMETRKEPKAKRLQHWYAAACKLADLCRVGKWEHHYRNFNKMADWLANRAMDGNRSEMVNLMEYHTRNGMQEGVEARMEGDMEQWRKQRQQV